MTDDSPRFVTVVSGLPRSGTSMMMQMLSAGGLAVLADQIREADSDNVKGYFELEPVKATKRDASWVEGAVGKAVKVVYLLLSDLPVKFEYRVLFLRRDLQEVVRSQQKMLLRRGEAGAGGESGQMVAMFQRQIEKTEQWLDRQANFQSLDVMHGNVIEDPQAEAQRVSDFLQIPLDTTAMAAVVDPLLYRQRTDAAS
jgi:hypothetical protein